MSIGAIGSSYQQYSTVNNNSSTIKSLEKQKESLTSQREQIAGSDSADKESQLQIIDAQIQQIDAQIQQLQNKRQSQGTQNNVPKKEDKISDDNGDEVRGGVIISASLKELIEKNKDKTLSQSS